MTNEQWERLLATIDGHLFNPPPVGFIIDSPWLPGWAGMSMLDYYASEARWLEANLAAIRAFPQVMFLPGFWSEYGMCTEPSAFGASCRFFEREFPFADKIIAEPEAIAALERPDPKTAGLLPFVLHRLVSMRSAIEREGHAIRFAVARGPLNIATFLMGTTEFFMAMRTHPQEIERLLTLVTDFLVEWLRLQASTIETIDGILVLDDPVGFCGPDDFSAFARPHLERVFQAFDAKVRFFHNDAKGLVCAPHLPKIGVNLFNFSFEHSVEDMKALTGNQVALLGNIPPRDVLANGTPGDVKAAVKSQLDRGRDLGRIVLSCGGGMPPETRTANIAAFLSAAGYD